MLSDLVAVSVAAATVAVSVAATTAVAMVAATATRTSSFSHALRTIYRYERRGQRYSVAPFLYVGYAVAALSRISNGWVPLNGGYRRHVRAASEKYHRFRTVKPL